MMHHVAERQAIFNEGFNFLFDILDDGLIVLDPEGRIVEVNRNLLNWLGYNRDEMVGLSFSQFNHPDGAQIPRIIGEILSSGSLVFEAEYFHKNGSAIPYEVNGKLIKFDGMDFVFKVVKDLAGRKQAENAASRLAYYDPLTELPNRRLILEQLKRASAVSHRSEKYCALLLFDLDNFNTVNNIRGYDTGDALLKQVAQRLKSALRDSDTVARLGGDEFVVILEDLGNSRGSAAEYAKETGEKLLNELTKPYQFDDEEYTGSASVGIALLGGRAKEDAGELLKQAGIAMNEAKTVGCNTLRFFDQAMQASIEQKARINTEMRTALRLRRFVPYYQILVDSRGYVTGAEVLIRWKDPQRGLIPPIEFISLAEESGLILSIGRWMMEEVCGQLKAWESQELTRRLKLSVNVSSREFKQKDFVGKLKRILEKTGANPSLLELEITESMLLGNMDDFIAKMQMLQEIGVSFALDDFGTGYSSLFYLKKLPLNKIKIDQSFVKDLGDDKNDEAIAQTIIQMGKTLGLEVTAEGVETERQRRVLEQLGCHYYQGYLFGKPVPLEIFEQQLDNTHLQNPGSSPAF